MLTQLFLKVAFVGSEWVLWILLLINFISVATIVDRILYLRRTKVDGDALGVAARSTAAGRRPARSLDAGLRERSDRMCRRGRRPGGA